MSNIKISIIVPVYNVQDYIEDCLRSIMNQTMQEEMECIIIDDCGNDNSINISKQLISSYSGKIQFRIVKHQVNSGLSSARNTGVKESRGEYVGFVDSDDYIEPTMYEELYRLIKTTPNAQFAATPIFEERDGRTTFFNGYEQYQHIDEISIEDYFKLFLTHQIDNASWNKLYRKSFFRHLFKEHRNNEDFLFFYQNCKAFLGSGSIVLLSSKPQYHYRIRQGSICQQNPKSVNMFFLDMLQNYREVISDIQTIPHEQQIMDSLDSQFRTILYYNFYHVLLNKQLADKRPLDVKQYWQDIKRIPLTQIPINERALTKEIIFIKVVPNGIKILTWIKSLISR